MVLPLLFLEERQPWKESVNIKQNEALIEVVKEIFTWYLIHNLLKM